MGELFLRGIMAEPNRQAPSTQSVHRMVRNSLPSGIFRSVVWRFCGFSNYGDMHVEPFEDQQAACVSLPETMVIRMAASKQYAMRCLVIDMFLLALGSVRTMGADHADVRDFATWARTILKRRYAELDDAVQDLGRYLMTVQQAVDQVDQNMPILSVDEWVEELMFFSQVIGDLS